MTRQECQIESRITFSWRQWYPGGNRLPRMKAPHLLLQICASHFLWLLANWCSLNVFHHPGLLDFPVISLTYECVQSFGVPLTRITIMMIREGDVFNQGFGVKNFASSRIRTCNLRTCFFFVAVTPSTLAKASPPGPQGRVLSSGLYSGGPAYSHCYGHRQAYSWRVYPEGVGTHGCKHPTRFPETFFGH